MRHLWPLATFVPSVHTPRPEIMEPLPHCDVELPLTGPECVIVAAGQALSSAFLGVVAVSGFTRVPEYRRLGPGGHEFQATGGLGVLGRRSVQQAIGALRDTVTRRARRQCVRSAVPRDRDTSLRSVTANLKDRHP